MQAIIYAAGVGMRLKSVFDHRPKILLEFAGKSLLERHVQCLREAGIGHLTIVTGYQQELISTGRCRRCGRFMEWRFGS